MMRWAASLLSLSLTTAQPAHIPTLQELPWLAITVVVCGSATGTAFHIGAGRYITAAHVVSFGACSIGGSPAQLRGVNGDLDIAELAGPPERPQIAIDCSGFKVNRHYLAIGYAAGLMRLNLPLIYSAFGRDPGSGNGLFVGTETQPGMSGGPLVGENYRVSGIVLQRWGPRARALSETYLCPSKGVKA